jgi:hypothetical protein
MVAKKIAPIKETKKPHPVTKRRRKEMDRPQDITRRRFLFNRLVSESIFMAVFLLVKLFNDLYQ